MLNAIYTYWFVPIPTLLAGLVLLRRMRQIQEEAAARALIPVPIERDETVLNNVADRK